LYLFAIDIGHSNLATNVSLLKAREVEDIYEGNDEQYRAATLSTTAEAAIRFTALSCACSYLQ